MRAQRAQDIEAVHLSHDHVADDRGRFVLECKLDAHIAIKGGVDGIALVGKVKRLELHQSFVVVDDQQRFVHYFLIPGRVCKSMLRRRSRSARSFAFSALRRSTSPWRSERSRRIRGRSSLRLTRSNSV